METGLLIGIVAFLILLFIWISTFIMGNAREHFLLRLLLVFFFLQMLILIAADAQKICEIVENKTTNIYLDSENYTATPEYNYTCVENPSKSSLTFLKLVNALNYLFWIYCILYISYLFLIKKGVIKTR
jgi:hypothetical protein